MKCPLCGEEIDHLEYLMTGQIKLKESKLDYESLKSSNNKVLTVFCTKCSRKLVLDEKHEEVLTQ